MKKDTRTTRRFKTGVELNWFGIILCASIYSALEVSRMFPIYMNFL